MSWPCHTGFVMRWAPSISQFLPTGITALTTAQMATPYTRRFHGSDGILAAAPLPSLILNFFSGCITFLFWVHQSHSGLFSLTSGCKCQTPEISELVFAFMSVSFVPLSTTELLLQSWSSPKTHYTLTNFLKYKVNMRMEHLKSTNNFISIKFFLQKKCWWPFLSLCHFYDVSWTVTDISWSEYLLYFLLPLSLMLAWPTLNKSVISWSYFPSTFKIFLNLRSLHPL